MVPVPDIFQLPKLAKEPFYMKTPGALRPYVKFQLLTGRPRVQTKWVWGPRERLRWCIFSVKYSIFLLLPWLAVGGAPALLFDLPSRHYYVFGQVFWPQDFYLLGLFLAVAAVMLAFSTALVARSWCGFACPQTLLTHLFMLIDHHVEGDRPSRLALDGGKSDLAHKARRALKHGLWLGISAILGFTFTSYFVGAHWLLRQALQGTLSGWPLGSWAFITGLTYLFAGHLRDWVCTTVCPYGRFQGTMQDADSLLVTYDSGRGEPRGKGAVTIARGGCVDCNQCVTACPMGIDIRNGPQFECISCMRCVDACDAMMGRVGAAPNLVRLASFAELEARALAPNAPWPVRGARHWLRPRVLVYAAVLAVLVGSLGSLVVLRPLLAIEVSRDPNRVFGLPGGRVGNFYHLTVLDKDTRSRAVRVRLEGIEGRLVGLDQVLMLPAGEIASFSASVVAAGNGLAAPRPFDFCLVDAVTGKSVGLAHATLVEPSR
jgi:cytochrome c oxidase accessory protein FixG